MTLTILFEHDGKTYQIETEAGYDAKSVRLPDGTILGIGWSETFPPTIEQIGELPPGEDVGTIADATEYVAPPEPKCSLTSACREPCVRGGMCVNCGGWINDP